MSDLARRATEPKESDLQSRIAFARALAEAGLLPAAYKKQPANILLAMDMAESLGIRLTQAISGLHVIDGKPSMSADLMLALVRRAGHRVRIVESTEKLCTVAITRRDDKENPYVATWSLDDAKRAGLDSRDTWKKYPRQMLRSRAISECCRLGANDVLAGFIYTPEELGDENHAEIVVTGIPEQRSSGSAFVSEPDNEDIPAWEAFDHAQVPLHLRPAVRAWFEKHGGGEAQMIAQLNAQDATDVQWRGFLEKLEIESGDQDNE